MGTKKRGVPHWAEDDPKSEGSPEGAKAALPKVKERRKLTLLLFKGERGNLSY